MSFKKVLKVGGEGADDYFLIEVGGYIVSLYLSALVFKIEKRIAKIGSKSYSPRIVCGNFSC